MHTKKVTLKVFRFNAKTDYLPYYKTYELEVSDHEVMLDLLNRIKWEYDGSFSYRRSCRHGICGACGIKVNGKSILACKENAFEMTHLFGDELILEPQSKKRAIKDMIIDKSDFWAKHEAVTPYVVADIDEHPEHENQISQAQLAQMLDADYCIQCGACHYACPVIEVNDEFFGPAAFVAAYRFAIDSRDNATHERLKATAQMGQGVWDCVKCFECQEACPKDIAPIEKITRLHTMQFEHKVAVPNIATRHAEGFVRSIKKHGFLDEADIVVYSEGYLGMYKHLKTAYKMIKAGKIHWNDGLPWVDNVPKSKNLEEIAKLIEISQTNKL